MTKNGYWEHEFDMLVRKFLDRIYINDIPNDDNTNNSSNNNDNDTNPANDNKSDNADCNIDADKKEVSKKPMIFLIWRGYHTDSAI